MQVTARGRYAVMAMVDLAGCVCRPEACCRAVRLTEIAERQGISLAFLEQIFCRLRQAGLVSAARGPGGGYRLARPAAEIPIIEILRGAGEPIRTTRCSPGGGPCMKPPAGGPPEREPRGRCETHDLWAALGNEIERFLASVTLADVIGKRLTEPEVAAA
ncbi:MAG TPA: Rrf2 family transcriptional regulator [Acetobacteraceae bacterium]|nr:Rrf2 family transcriptional regulator [Acetobacteraceae bacterium]